MAGGTVTIAPTLGSAGVSIVATVAPEQLERSEVDERVVPDRPWVTIVWNDPVNLMAYVTYVFQKLFGYDREKAHRLMLDVHHEGQGGGQQRHPRADGARRDAAARLRPVGDAAAGRVTTVPAGRRPA